MKFAIIFRDKPFLFFGSSLFYLLWLSNQKDDCVNVLTGKFTTLRKRTSRF